MKKFYLAVTLTCLVTAITFVIGCMGDSGSDGPACNPPCGEGTECVYVEGTTTTTCQVKETAGCDPACTADQTCTDGVCVDKIKDPAVCGNAICDDGETEASCPADCTGGGNGTPVCGNGTCETGETAADCPADCGGGGTQDCSTIHDCLDDCTQTDNACIAGCTDQGTTEAQAQLEAFMICQQNAGCAGDAACIEEACAAEVAACFGGAPAAVCGNGQCEAGEDQNNCAADCAGGGPVCGNGQCEAGEDQNNCAADCGGGGPVCGNGQCEAGESAANCPQDCGGGGGLTCAQIFDCLQTNNCQDEACIMGCYDQGDPAAQAGFMAIAQCFQNSGCPENDQACLQQACAAEMEACLGGGGPAVCGNGICDAGETPDGCPDDCGGGGACGDIDYVGLCEGNVVKWCEGGQLQEIDCSQGGDGCICGFKEDAGFYDCTGQCG